MRKLLVPITLTTIFYVPGFLADPFVWDAELGDQVVEINVTNFHKYQSVYHLTEENIDVTNGLSYEPGKCGQRRSDEHKQFQGNNSIFTCAPRESYIRIWPYYPDMRVDPQMVPVMRCHAWSSSIDCQPTKVKRVKFEMDVKGADYCVKVFLTEHVKCEVCSNKEEREKCEKWDPFPACKCNTSSQSQSSGNVEGSGMAVQPTKTRRRLNNRAESYQPQ